MRNNAAASFSKAELECCAINLLVKESENKEERELSIDLFGDAGDGGVLFRLLVALLPLQMELAGVRVLHTARVERHLVRVAAARLYSRELRGSARQVAHSDRDRA